MFELIDVKYKHVLDFPHLIINGGKITTLSGPSGCGKTTILRLLNKMISPTQGRILFNSMNLEELNSVTHRQQVTMLSQNPAVFEGTIRDNLLAGLRFRQSEIPNDAVLKSILEKVHLKMELDSEVNNISGGEKQRLALGRVLLLHSEVYLMDEPSSALDEETANSIIQMVTEHVKKEKKTLVMVTHAKPIAETYSDIIIEIAAGKHCKTRGYHL